MILGENMPSRLLRLSQRLSRRFCSSPNPSPSPSPNPTPQRESVSKTVNKVFKQRDLDKLVAGFKKASESYRFRCKHRIYEIAVRRLVTSGRLDAVEEILEDQKRYAEDIAHEGFAVRLIGLYGRAGMAANAAATFHQLPSLRCPRTVMSFNALLTACADSRDFDRMAAVFHEVPSSDPSIIPNLISYNIMIQAFCEKGDPDAALDALQLMERSGIAPDPITFNILLNGFYGNSRFSDAEKIWERMRERNIEPDTKSFNAKLRGLVSGGKTVEAVELVGELKNFGLKPDTFTFNALIKGYCGDGNLEEAKRVYMDLTKNDCAPNRPTFETLIPYLCKAGELDLAIKLCNESMSRRSFTNVAVLQGVVDGLVKASRVEEAKKLVDLGRANYYPKKCLRMPSEGSIA